MESERHDNRRNHILREPLKAVIQINTDKSSDEIAEILLGMLSDYGVISYCPKGVLGLLTPTGRVLVALTERPGITMREIALYLGVTESNIAKSIASLVKANLIVRTKVKGRNMYHLNPNGAFEHPDIIRFGAAVNRVIQEATISMGDITPTSGSDDPNSA
jgi:predicted HTH transcriptional regulator